MALGLPPRDQSGKGLGIAPKPDAATSDGWVVEGTKTKKKGSFLGEALHDVGQVAKWTPVGIAAQVAGNVAKDASLLYQAPIGAVHQAKGLAQDLGSLAYVATHPSAENAQAYRDMSRTWKTVRDMGYQYKNYYYNRDVLKNIWNHPLQFALDALTVSTLGGAGAAKLGQAGMLGERGAMLGKAGTRSFETSKGTVTKATSKNPTTRYLQNLRHSIILRTTARIEDGWGSLGPIPGYAGRGEIWAGENLRGLRVLQRKQDRITKTILNRNLAPFDRAFRGLTGPEEVAISLRAQGLHPDVYMPFLKEQLAGAMEKLDLAVKAEDPVRVSRAETLVRAHERMIKWAEKVTPDMYDAVTTVPKYKRAYDQAKTLMDKAAEEGVNLNLLNPDDVANRPWLSARVISGARYTPYEEIAQKAIEANPNRQAIIQELGKLENVSPAELADVMDYYDTGIRFEASRHGGTAEEIIQRTNDLYSQIEVQVLQNKFVPQEMWKNLPDRLAQAARNADASREGIINAIDSEVQRILSKETKVNQRADPHNQTIPEQFRTREGIAAEVDRLTAMALEGQIARDWYHQSGLDILAAVNGNMKDARTMARLVALTSPQQAVFQNTKTAIELWNAYKRLGDKGFAEQVRRLTSKEAATPSETTLGVTGLVSGKQIEAALRVLRGDAPDTYLGLKTHSFYRNFLQEFDPKGFEREYPGETADRGPVTFDTWMRRALNWPRKFAKTETLTPRAAKQFRNWRVLTDEQKAAVEAGKSVKVDRYTDPLSTKQYEFGEFVTSAIADSLGWKPHEAQAAMWTAIKDSWEGQTGAGGAFHIGDAIRRLKDENGVQILLQEARKDPGVSPDWQPYTGGQTFYEPRPVTNTAAKNVYDALSPEEKARYATEIQDVIRNRFEEILGLKPQGTRTGPGVWRGKIEPGGASHVELPEGILSPELVNTMDTLTAAQGWAQHAGSVSWGHKVPRDTPIGGDVYEGRHWTPPKGTDIGAIDDLLNPPGQEGTIGLMHAREGGFDVVNFGGRADFSEALDAAGVAAGRENNRWQGSYTIDRNAPEAGWPGEKTYQDIIDAHPKAAELKQAIAEAQAKVNDFLGLKGAEWLDINDIPEGGIPGRVFHTTNAAGEEGIKAARRVEVGGRTEPAAAHFSDTPWPTLGNRVLSLPKEAMGTTKRGPFGNYAVTDPVLFQDVRQIVGTTGEAAIGDRVTFRDSKGNQRSGVVRKSEQGKWVVKTDEGRMLKVGKALVEREQGQARAIYIPGTENRPARMVFGQDAGTDTLIHEWGHHLATYIKGTPEEKFFAKKMGALLQKDGSYVWPREAEEQFANLYMQWARDQKGAVGDALRKQYNQADLPELDPTLREHLDKVMRERPLKSGKFEGGLSLEELQASLPDLIAFPHIGEALKPEAGIPGRSSGVNPPVKPGLSRMNKGFRLLASQWLPHPSAWRQQYLKVMGYAGAVQRHDFAFEIGRELGPGMEKNPGWYYVREGTTAPTRAQREANALIDAYNQFETKDGGDLEAYVKNNASTQETSIASQWEKEGFRVRQISPGEHKLIFGEFRQVNKMVQKWIDSPTNVWRTLTLTYRPAWVVNNFVGQTLLYAMNHTFNGGLKAYAEALVEEIKRDNSLPDELRMDGFFANETPQMKAAFNSLVRAEHKTRSGIQRFNAAVSDSIPRNATYKAIINKIAKTNEDAARLSKYIKEHKGNTENLPAELHQLHDEIVQQTLDELIDFGNLSDFERRYIRRFVPFYSWIKGIMKATGHLAFEHPARALILFHLSQQGQQIMEEKYGSGADILKGFVASKDPSGGVVAGFGTAGLNPWATPAQIADVTRASFGLGPPTSPGDNPIFQMNPVIQAGVAALAGVDPFSKKENKSGAVVEMLKQLGMAPPEYDLIKGLISPQNGPRKLTPQQRLDLIARFLGVPYTHKRISTAKSLGRLQESKR